MIIWYGAVIAAPLRQWRRSQLNDINLDAESVWGDAFDLDAVSDGPAGPEKHEQGDRIGSDN